MTPIELIFFVNLKFSFWLIMIKLIKIKMFCSVNNYVALKRGRRAVKKKTHQKGDSLIDT